MIEARHSWGLRINFNHLGFSNMHPMHGTWVLLHFARNAAALKLWFDSTSSSFAVQRHRHYATMAGFSTTSRNNNILNDNAKWNYLLFYNTPLGLIWSPNLAQENLPSHFQGAQKNNQIWYWAAKIILENSNNYIACKFHPNSFIISENGSLRCISP